MKRGAVARTLLHEIAPRPINPSRLARLQQWYNTTVATIGWRVYIFFHNSQIQQQIVALWRWQHHIQDRFVLHGLILLVTMLVTLHTAFPFWSWLTLPLATLTAELPTAETTDTGSLTDDTVTVAPPFATPDTSNAAIDLTQPAIQIPQPVHIPAFQATHQLAPGETLGTLADHYGVSIESLIWANDLQNGDVLAIDQELRIPSLSGIPYVIQPGDTLELIASRAGVVAEAIWLFESNGLQHVDFDQLPSGHEIFIPGGTQPLPEALLTLRGGLEGLAASQAQPAGLVREPQTNLRAGPDLVYERVARLDAERRVQLLARHAQWLKVDAAGTTGWVRVDLLEIPDGLLETLPETNDFPPPPPIWVWPTHGRITSGFGPRWGGFHNGLDIANRAWTPIVAARAGQVVEAGWCSGYGYCVRINHAGGLQTVYGHLIDQPVVRAGQAVAVGQLIGHMGSTYDARGGGYSTGVHLHFEVRVNGRAVDPLRFLP